VVLPTPAINPPYQLPAAFRDATPKWKQLPKMFNSSEDAHAFLVSIFGGVEHLRPITPPAGASDTHRAFGPIMTVTKA
jgi:hypothetical protein